MARYGRTRATAKYGDTWGSLSKRTGVPVTDLVKANKALKPIAGVKIIVPKSGLTPQVAGPTAPPTLPGSTGSGGGGGGDKKYKTENGQNFYKFNKSGRDHEQGDWLPTTAYDAWKGEPDSHWAFNGRNWYGAKGKPQGPQWKPGKTPLPYGGGPPPNWSVGTKYMLDPEKGTYYYWSTYDWAWKVGGAKKKGGGGGGGGNSAYDEAPYRPPYDPNETQVSMPTLYETKPKIIDQPTVNYQDAQGYQYGQPTAGNTLSYFNGPTLGYGNYGTTPGYNQGSLPSYIGLVNWRF